MGETTAQVNSAIVASHGMYVLLNSMKDNSYYLYDSIMTIQSFFILTAPPVFTLKLSLKDNKKHNCIALQNFHDFICYRK
jgi:hypothetical protein